MKYRYPKLSLGYIGQCNPIASLNSKFFNLLHQKINNDNSFLTNIMPLTQRIPRSDFFYELFNLENDTYRLNLCKLLDQLKSNHKIACSMLANNPNNDNSRLYINYTSILLRYGEFDYLQNNIPTNLSNKTTLEIELLNDSINTEIELSNDQKISLDIKLKLAKKYLHKPSTTNREKILLLNQIIVNYYRHRTNYYNTEQIFDHSKTLLDLLQNNELKTILDYLYSSISYRGLAMVNEFGEDSQFSFLMKAESLARSMLCETEIEQVVADDNLFTCLQSIAKWHLQKNNLTECEKYLINLAKIDPHDSTAYSEIAFFYTSVKDYNNAAINFHTAMKLGPPGTGMNAYYYAKCLQFLGKHDEAIETLYIATDLDPDGISTWLDLIQAHTDRAEKIKAIQIANRILKTPVLSEQLEDAEKNYLHTLLS